jgi:hypothetical protein
MKTLNSKIATLTVVTNVSMSDRCTCTNASSWSRPLCRTPWRFHQSRATFTQLCPCSLGEGVSAGPNRQHAPENNNFTKFLCHLPAIRSISSTIIYISRQLFSTSQRSVFASPATTTSALPNSPSTVLDLAYLRGNEAGTAVLASTFWVTRPRLPSPFPSGSNLCCHVAPASGVPLRLVTASTGPSVAR